MDVNRNWLRKIGCSLSGREHRTDIEGGKVLAMNNEKQKVNLGTVGVAMVTPFHEDGSLDIDTAVKLAEHLVAQGVDLLVLSGTTGESPTTHQPEKNQLVADVKAAVGGKAQIMAGAGSNDTAHAVRMATAAQEHGADSLLVVTPYYNRPSQEGIYQHVKAIADATDLPICLYDIPGRTGLALSSETISRLAEIPQVVALKDATGNPAQGMIRAAESGLNWYSGDDGLNYTFLNNGAAGVISVVGHLAAAEYRKMYTHIQNREYEAARALSLKLQKLVDAIMGTGQGAVMAKAALKMQGVLKNSTLRLPLVPATTAELEQLEKVLREYALV